MARRPSLGLIVPDPTQSEAAEQPVQREPTKKPSARDGKRPVMFWIDAAAYQELQVATKRMNTTIQRAGEEMFLLWCQKHAVKLPNV